MTPVLLGAEGPLGLVELVEVEWAQCWASSMGQHSKKEINLNAA